MKANEPQARSYAAPDQRQNVVEVGVIRHTKAIMPVEAA